MSTPNLTTEAEKSGFKRTGRHDEVLRLCHDFEASDKRVKCVTFGTTPEGRQMVAMVASADGTFTPQAAHAKGRDALVIQGGIHAGEIEGKDAIFIALRELLAGKMAPGVLGKVTIVLVPVFNVDGAERFEANNRPNQRGPEEMGFRATAQNLNLNRDYVKGDAPEMRAMLALLNDWDPIVYVDLHTTDGAQFQPDISIQVSPEETHAGLERIAAGLSDAFMKRMTAMKHMPLPFYPDFIKHDEPKSGFDKSQAPPRFSHEYWAARNRIGILVETQSWKTYQQRVIMTKDTLQVLFEQATTDAPAWRAAAKVADEAGEKLGGTDVTMVWKASSTPRTVDFPGYVYTVKTSDLSGRPWISYDETKPEMWHLPLFDKLEPALTLRAPRAGYLVSAAHAPWLVPLLKLQGIRYAVVDREIKDKAVKGYQIDDITYEKPFEGRTMVKLKGSWQSTKQSLPAGSLFIPIAQPRALMAMHVLEPEAPDSLAAWGHWNAMFEQKEYMEPYVLEVEARKMLAADPKLKAEFEKRLQDEAFAKSPEQRLKFFYVRHPAWDQRMGWVPVWKVDEQP